MMISAYGEFYFSLQLPSKKIGCSYQTNTVSPRVNKAFLKGGCRVSGILRSLRLEEGFPLARLPGGFHKGFPSEGSLRNQKGFQQKVPKEYGSFSFENGPDGPWGSLAIRACCDSCLRLQSQPCPPRF